MKRIAFTVTNDLSYDQRMIRICSTLSEAGYEIHLIGRRKSNSIELEKRPYHQYRFNLFFNQGKLFYFEYNLRLFIDLLFRRFDIICAIDLDTILPVFLISKIKKVRFAFDAHEFFTEVPELIHRPRIKAKWEWVGKLAVPHADLAYTVNDSLAGILTKKYGVAFEVVRNLPYRKLASGIDAEQKFSPFILIYQGVLNEGRGLEETIQAMKLMDDTELWITGEGDLSLKLRTLTKEMQLESKVKFLGRIPPAELPNFTAKAHLGLNLLNESSMNYYYSLANKAVDYIQAGMPSLNMNFPEYTLLQKQYNAFILINELKPEKIAEEVIKIKKDRKAYYSLKENCIRAAGYLCWEKEKSKLLALFQNLAH